MNYLPKRALKSSSFPAFALLFLFIMLNIIITRGFLSSDFINGFFSSNAAIICIAIGSGLVIIGGGIDISLGAMVTLINTIFIQLLGLKWSVGAAILACIMISLALGAINGFVIGFLRVTPLLATFATASIFTGLALWVLPMPGGSIPESFGNWYSSSFLGIPMAVFIILIVFILALIIKLSPLGFGLYAMGKDINKAYVSAVPVRWIQLLMYMFSGLTAGIASIALTANVGGGDPTIGIPLTMTCIAACVIGGIDLAGGVGDVLGAIFGAMFLELVIITVFSANVQPFVQDFISGLILLVGIFGAVLFSRRNSRAR